MRLLVALIAWIGAAAAAAGVSSAVAGSIHNSPSGSSSGFSSGFSSPSGGSSYDASNVKSTDSDSMFKQANLAKALAVASRELGADAPIDNAVIYPGYLSLTAVKNGSEVDFYINSAGTTDTTSSGGSPVGQSVFALSRMTADVPGALVQRIAAAADTPESQLHYMVINSTPAPKPLQWDVYTVEGSKISYFESSGATGPLFEENSNGLQRIRG